jgi:arabinofuranosyltransferase
VAEIGQGRRGLVAGAYVVAAAAAALALWGFTVDDALISVQYARNLASGAGYRFDPGGIVTDGVTPLPWPFLLYPLAKGGALAVLFRARVLGAVLYVVAGGALGWSIARTAASRVAKLAGALMLLFCIPAAAHAVTGMQKRSTTASARSLRGSRLRFVPR